MQKVILSLLITLSLYGDIMLYPFGSHASYDNGFKSSDTSLGFYLEKKSKSGIFKAGYEFKDTSYTNSAYDNYQNDLIASYSMPLSFYIMFNAAAHFTISNLDQANHNRIYLAGITYTQKERFILGADLAYSNYNSKSLAKKTRQFSPYFGFWYGNRLSTLGKVFIKFNYYYINLDEVNISLQKNFNSAEFSIKQYTQNFINMFAYSFGKSLYLVKNGGFTVFNNNEINTQEFILSSAYKMTASSLIKFSYIHRRFDAYTPDLAASKKNITSQRLLLSASLKF